MVASACPCQAFLTENTLRQAVGVVKQCFLEGLQEPIICNSFKLVVSRSTLTIVLVSGVWHFAYSTLHFQHAVLSQQKDGAESFLLRYFYKFFLFFLFFLFKLLPLFVQDNKLAVAPIFPVITLLKGTISVRIFHG